MHRRELLALCGLAGVSGCLGYEIQQRETVVDRRVHLAELEATVEARDVRITDLESEVARLERRLAQAESSRDTLARRLDGPRVNDVALVDRWDRLGDVVHRATTRSATEGLATVAVNFTTPAVETNPERGRQAEAAERLTTVAVTLRDSAGRVVETRERELRYFVDVGRLGETQLLFDTRGLTPGEYVAEARVRDVVANVTSEPLTTRFSLV